MLPPHTLFRIPRSARPAPRPAVSVSRCTTAGLALALLMTGGCLARSSNGTLAALLDEIWAFELESDPLRATAVGDPRWNDRLPTMTPEALSTRADARRAFLARLERIDRGALTHQRQIDFDMARRDLRAAITDYEFGAYRIPILADDGFHIAFARLPDMMPLKTEADYDNYISRLRGFARYANEEIALMREGLEAGFTMPKVVLKGYEVTIASHIVDDPTAGVFWKPFAHFPTTVPTMAHERLTAAGRAAILEGVVPGYQAFLDFMTDEYIPGARTTISASDLPDGRAYYDHLVRYFTTLDRSPEEIHEIGLREVSRIKEEMKQVIEEVGFEGGFPAFLEFLRTDPRFYARTPHELLREAAYIAKTMDGKLPSLFKTLPRTPYGVAPVPANLAPKYTSGRYIEPTPGGTEAGYYWVNTYALESRPLYALPALTLHEAVPGHHLQIALAQELTDLPPFRRFGYLSAFGEGWGLYAEWLGIEAGMYTTPYTRFGRLTYEMWRACRLVVDTGIHAFGWSRERALDYLASNTALSLHEVQTETDRYISWPGQALAYKMGEIAIRELRSEAEAALGTAFDVRDFHDVVLRNGAVPLTVLQDEVRQYLAERAPR